jgi:hypothetical protein
MSILKRSFILFLCLSISAHPQDIQYRVVNNEVCYDNASQKKLDEALKVGVDCQLKLAQKRECKQNKALCDDSKKDVNKPQGVTKVIAIITASFIFGFVGGLALNE